MAQTNSFPTNPKCSKKLIVIGLWDSAVSILIRMTGKLRPELIGARVAPLARPKQLLAAISNKTIRCGRKKRDTDMEVYDDKEFGLWQRSILMGEKCEPLAFSGVIYYDGNGKQLDEIPMRSPRASPLPRYLYETRTGKAF